MSFNSLFKNKKPLIACIHLMPLPGSPGYSGNMDEVFNIALNETEIYKRHSVDGLIVENFRDVPFYPDKLPAETIAAMSSITREIVKVFQGTVGVNALRNDAQAAMAIAVATQANFIRVNVHTGAAITDQGLIQGKAFKTLRLRESLKSNVLIFADVDVKHAVPLGNRGLPLETKDLTERGLADAIIVSGDGTGKQTELTDIKTVKENTHLPVILGSGVTPDNLKIYYEIADGFIVGSYFKKDGIANNRVDEERVIFFVNKMKKKSKFVKKSKMETLQLSLNKKYTYADYLTWLDEKRRELINGFIHLMSPAPATKHQKISGKIHLNIGNYLLSKNSCEVFSAPFDVRLPKSNNDKTDDKIYTVVQPDICIVCSPEKLDERGCLGAPDLIVEILSPSTSKKDITEKFTVYEQSGVKEYWIVNPNDENINVFVLDDNGKYQLSGMYAGDMKIKVSIFDDLEISLEDIFKK